MLVLRGSYSKFLYHSFHWKGFHSNPVPQAIDILWCKHLRDPLEVFFILFYILSQTTFVKSFPAANGKNVFLAIYYAVIDSTSIPLLLLKA